MTQGYRDSCETFQYYSVQLHPEQGAYLLGNLQVEPRAYDPFSRMEEILLALLRIGWRFRRGENVDLDAQSFCVRYGLLGFEQAEAEKRYEDGSVKLYADSVLHTKALTTEQQEYLFRPFQRELHLQRRQVGTGKIKLELSDFSGDDFATLEPDYAHCEAVVWYGRYGLQLLEYLERFQAGECFALTPGNARMQYCAENGQAVRRWTFDSLKSACGIGFAEMLLDSVPAVRLCKRCGKPFLTHHTRAAYCSPSCRNVENVKQSRRRKRSGGT